MRAFPTPLAPTLLLLALAALAACDGPTQPAPDDGLELSFQRGVAVALSDTAVIVDGHRRIGVPGADRSVHIYYQESFEYGGIGGFESNEIWFEGRFGRLQFQSVDQAGDTMVFSHRDFGDVTMGGEAMGKLTDIPDISGAPFPVRFDSFVLYHNTAFHRVAWPGGGVHTYVDRPFDSGLVEGTDVALTATGGSGGEAFATTLRTRPMPRVTGLASGEPLDYRHDRPVLSVDRPLALEFDRPLDPQRSAFVLFPWFEGLDQETRRAATAFGWPDRAASRVLLPAATLAAALDAVGVDSYEFVLYVLHFEQQDDAVVTRDPATGEDVSLALAQTGETRFFVRLER